MIPSCSGFFSFIYYLPYLESTGSETLISLYPKTVIIEKKLKLGALKLLLKIAINNVYAFPKLRLGQPKMQTPLIYQTPY